MANSVQSGVTQARTAPSSERSGGRPEQPNVDVIRVDVWRGFSPLQRIITRAVFGSLMPNKEDLNNAERMSKFTFRGPLL